MALRTIQINGQDIADVIGWRYANMELSWGTLPQFMLQILTGMSGVCTITFRDVDGQLVTEEIRPMSQVYIGTRMLGHDGKPLWRDVKLGVSFINVHN